jgi:hypothetical protein
LIVSLNSVSRTDQTAGVHEDDEVSDAQLLAIAHARIPIPLSACPYKVISAYGKPPIYSRYPSHHSHEAHASYTPK